MKTIFYSNINFLEFEIPNEYYEWISSNYNENYFNQIYKFDNYDNMSPILLYKGQQYNKINRYLRNTYPKIEDDYDKQMIEKVKNIQNFIINNPIKENLITYRYVCEKEYKFLCHCKRKIKIINQFLSTTATPHFCTDHRYNTGKLIKILLLKNTPAIVFTDINKKIPECEVLLPFKIQLKFLQFEQQYPVFICGYKPIEI